MKKIIVLLSIFLFTITAYAGDNKSSDFIDNFAKIKTFKADFTQTNDLTDFGKAEYSGDSRKFNEIDKLKIFVEKIKSNKHTHQPTKTSTNACCCECKPSEYKLELNSLVTDSNSDVIKVDALFPADAQSVSGVYCLIIRWTEKTEDLIA